MRIVGGTLGGRRFPGPPSDVTRPTSERVREALASALVSRDAIAGARVLDLFAGTGALAFEALSRGADRAVLVEKDRRVARALTQSVEALGLEDRAVVVQATLAESLPPRVVREAPFDLVFMDPPYAAMSRALPLLASLSEHLSERALVVLEYPTATPPELPLPVVARYEYGVAALAFMERQ